MLKLKEKIILAPLSGCSDLAFRLIAREHGARFCFFEMVDANALTHNSHPQRSLEILNTDPRDKPIAAQILGESPDQTLKAAEKLLCHARPEFLDINAACPARKVVKKRSGAYLLKEPKTLYNIVRLLSRSLPLPITVKLRIGYSRSDIKEITSIARGCQKAGASALFVHGRTMQQLYSGEIDYKAIKAVKEAVDIPVYGSGNIMDPISAERMLNDTGCDGILVARGAFGNPWIFENIERHFAGKNPVEIGTRQRLETLKRHLAYLDKFIGDAPRGKIGRMRKVAIWYMRNLHGAAALRNRISGAGNYAELIGLLDSLQHAGDGGIRRYEPEGTRIGNLVNKTVL